MRNRNREYDLEYSKRYQKEHPERTKAYNQKYYAEHKQYFKDRVNAWRESHREEYRTYMRQYHDTKYHRRYHGVDKAKYLAMCEAQDHLCGICNRKRALVVDHCHKTGYVRGLLCRSCNTAIGYLRENPDYFHAALKWIERRPA